MGNFDCLARPRVQYVTWGRLTAYFSDSEGNEILDGYDYRVDPDAIGGPSPADVELPDGISFGMSYGEAADLYPDGAYTNDTLGIDSILFTTPHTLTITAQESPDRSAPITRVSVGVIPVCD